MPIVYINSLEIGSENITLGMYYFFKMFVLTIIHSCTFFTNLKEKSRVNIFLKFQCRRAASTYFLMT